MDAPQRPQFTSMFSLEDPWNFFSVQQVTEGISDGVAGSDEELETEVEQSCSLPDLSNDLYKENLLSPIPLHPSSFIGRFTPSIDSDEKEPIERGNLLRSSSGVFDDIELEKQVEQTLIGNSPLTSSQTEVEETSKEKTVANFFENLDYDSCIHFLVNAQHEYSLFEFEQYIIRCLEKFPLDNRIISLFLQKCCYHIQIDKLSSTFSRIPKPTFEMLLLCVRTYLRAGKNIDIQKILPTPEIVSENVFKLKVHLLCVQLHYSSAIELIKNTLSKKQLKISPSLCLQVHFDWALREGRVFHLKNILDQILHYRSSRNSFFNRACLYRKASSIELYLNKFEEALKYIKLAIVQFKIHSSNHTSFLWKFYARKSRILLLMGKKAELELNNNKMIIFSNAHNPTQRHLELAGQQEFMGDFKKAEKMYELCLKNLKDPQTKQQVCVHYLNFLLRTGQLDKGMTVSVDILKEFPELGWIVIQFKALRNDTDCLEFAKSYEVASLKTPQYWCERARLHMNPCSKAFSIKEAEECLNLSLMGDECGDIHIEIYRFNLIKLMATNQLYSFHNIPKGVFDPFLATRHQNGMLSLFCGAHPIELPTITLEKITVWVKTNFLDYKHYYENALNGIENPADDAIYFHHALTFFAESLITGEKPLNPKIRYQMIFNGFKETSENEFS